MLKVFLRAILGTILVSQTAFAQNFLEQLEKKIEQVLPPPVNTPSPPAATPIPPPEPKPEASAGYLGARIDRDATGSLRVLEVLRGSPADQGGMQAGDVVRRINGTQLTELGDLTTQLAGKSSGAKIAVEIERRGKLLELPITIGVPPNVITENESIPTPLGGLNSPMTRVPIASNQHASLGISVSTVTDEARHLYRLAVRNGALISAIRPGSAADQAGLPLGGVIVAAEGRRIDTPEDLIELVQQRKPGDEVILSYYQGSTLFRKTVRLGVAEGQAIVPNEMPLESGERPILRRLEKALDGISRPAPGASPLVPPTATDELNSLRAELDALRTQVRDLESRLKSLEQTPALK